MSKRSALFAGAILLSIPATAAAQEAPDEPGVSVGEEIIVTARRRSESLSDTPLNLQVVTGETLAAIGADDAVDYARFVPGLSFSDDGPRGGAIMVLRGLRSGGEGGLGVSLGVTTSSYVDDIQVDLPGRGAPLDLKILDVDRVEVLRGPQGTLYGAGSIGGALRYISTRPVLDEFSGRFEGTLSTTEGGGEGGALVGGVNIPIVQNVLALRANLGVFEDGGYIDDIGLGRENVNDATTTSGRVALRYQPNNDLTVDLSYYYQRGEYGAGNDVNESLGRYVTQGFAPEDGALTTHLANLSATYDFGWASLTSSSSYVDEDIAYLRDATISIRDMLYADIIDFGVFIGDLPPDTVLPPFVVRTSSDLASESFVQELRLASPSGGVIEWLAGAYYNYYTLSDVLQERVPNGYAGQAEFETALLDAGYIGGPFNDELEYVINGRENFRQWALFGEATFNLTPEWSVSVGARHFDYRRRRTEYQIDQWLFRTPDGFAITEPAPEDYTYGASDDDGQIYRLNTAYDFGSGLVYATLASGYRPGGFNASAPNSVPPPQYDPDTVISFEIGGKVDLLDNRVYTSAAIYNIDWSDIQTSVLDDNFNVIMGNAGKAISRGVEIELITRDLLAPGLTTTIAYGYNEAELRESVPWFGFDGDRVPMVPRHTASFMVDYERPFGDGLLFGANANASYTGESYAAFGAMQPDDNLDPVANDQYLRLDAYWLANVSLRFGTERVMGRLFVDNVFDEDPTLSRGFLDTSFSPYVTPFIARAVGRPRTVGLSVSVRY